MSTQYYVPSEECSVCIPEDAIRLTSLAAEQTRSWGQALAPLLAPGDIICLVGELGAGKTCFAQGIGRGLGLLEPITSPTFIRVREHSGCSVRPRLYHIDLYRLVDGSEALDWGVDEYLFGEGVCVIEWADRIHEFLPTSCLWIWFLYGQRPEERRIALWAEGDRGQQVLSQFQELIPG
jgi:tRNA threonylcarbamoyladenosine biosynthesis protein TsaE